MIAPFDLAQELLNQQLTNSNNYTLQIDRITSLLSMHTVTG